MLSIPRGYAGQIDFAARALPHAWMNEARDVDSKSPVFVAKHFRDIVDVRVQCRQNQGNALLAQPPEGSEHDP